MKNEFAKSILEIAKEDKNTIFFTGDLGFNAFEDLTDAIKTRFINAGVAEQNMVDVAAGMAYMGLKPWVYSISPFLILKTVEQIRNDICNMNLPVKLVGNGGGYGYGIMGSTHHLLEDIAILSTFSNMKIYIPAYLSDVKPIVEKMHNDSHPSYLRLGASGITSTVYAPFRRVKKGEKLTIVVLGPLLENVLNAVDDETDVWSVTEIPFRVPPAFYESIKKTGKLMILEEHVENGGLGQMIQSLLALKGIPAQISHIFCKGYPSKLYGSQQFHLKENGLDPQSISASLKKILHG